LHPIQMLHLVRRDTVDGICESIHAAPAGSQLWLVAPWRLAALTRLVALKRIRRVADASAVDVRLVSRHFQTRALAREAGLPVYFFTPQGLDRVERPAPDSAALPDRLAPVEAPLGARWHRRPRPLGLGSVLLTLAVVLLLAATMAGVAGALVPHAVVTIEPVSSPVQASLTVHANPTYHEVMADQSIVPARRMQVIVEGRGEIAASGGTDVAGAYASGEIILSNRTSESVTVPKGTVVRTGSGTNVRFYTVADVTLPPVLYGQATVGIVAVDPGPSGNVKALTITAIDGDAARLADVLNNAPTTGGTTTREATVAAQDLDALQASVLGQLQQEAYQQLVAALGPDEFIPANSLDVQIMSYSFAQVVGERSDVVSMDMKVVAGGFAISNADLNTLATLALEAQAQGGGEILQVIPDSLDVQRAEQVQVLDRELVFDVQASGRVASVIDVQQVKLGIRGRELDRATEWLAANYDLSAAPEITVTPSFWPWVPWLPARFDVNVSAGD
jgi:hypothetical protein